MAARVNAPVIGAEGYVYQPANSWQVSTVYRYQHSDRHFRGSHEEENRQAEHSEVINDIHLFDVSVNYAFNSKYSVSLSVPILDMNRSQPIRDANRNVVDRFSTQAGGIGDMVLAGRAWMFQPETHPDSNISLGLGIKFPTGDHDVTDTFVTSSGGEVRSVDQSIQPGDGGWGILLEASAFKVINDFNLFGSMNYLSNPKGTNGTPTFRGRESESIMSVADQYLARTGVAFSIPGLAKHGFSASTALRLEGVPAHDLLGPSRGFRRPGYALSLEPGIIYARSENTFSVHVPVALQRNRTRSVPDELDQTHGDAAFADWLLLVGYSRRF